MDWDGSVPVTDNVFGSWCVMGPRCVSESARLAPHKPRLAPPIFSRALRVHDYLSVSRWATILVASSSVIGTLGIAVPGLLAGGSRIHFFKSSGPVLLTAPLAI